MPTRNLPVIRPGDELGRGLADGAAADGAPQLADAIVLPQGELGQQLAAAQLRAISNSR